MGEFGQPLAEFLGEGDLGKLLAAIADAGLRVSRRIASGPFGGDLSAIVGANTGGESQKALDIFADDTFAEILRGAGVRGMASEEREAPVQLDSDGAFLVGLDPLDGSSNIETNVTMGSIVAIFDAPARAGVEAADFLQKGHKQRAAALVLYGP